MKYTPEQLQEKPWLNDPIVHTAEELQDKPWLNDPIVSETKEEDKGWLFRKDIARGASEALQSAVPQLTEGSGQLPYALAKGALDLIATVPGVSTSDDALVALGKGKEFLNQQEDSVTSAVNEAYPQYKDLTPAHRTATSVLTTLASGGAGAELAAHKVAKIADDALVAARSILGSSAGEFATTGTGNTLEPLTVNTEGQDRDNKRLALPLENIGAGAVLTGAFRGLGKIFSKTEAPSAESSVDPLLSKGESAVFNTSDRLFQLRKIESQADNLSTKYRENTPETAALSRELQREPELLSRVAQEGFPSAGGTAAAGTEGDLSGLRLMTRRDVGLDEIEVPKGVTAGSVDDPNVIPSLKNVRQRIEEAGGDYEEALQARTASRQLADQRIATEDAVAKQTAVQRAKEDLSDLKAYAIESDPEDILRVQAAEDALKKAESMPIRRRLSETMDVPKLEAQVAEYRSKPWSTIADEQLDLNFKGYQKLLYDSGNISSTENALLSNFYRPGEYFPLKRQPEFIDNSDSNIFKSTSKGKGLNAAKGGGSAYVAPEEALINYHTQVVTAAQRNKVLNKVADIIEKLDPEDWNKVFKTPKDDYVAQTTGQSTKQLSKLTEDDQDALQSLVGEYIGPQAPKGITKEGELTFLRNGNKVTIDISDPNIAKFLKTLGTPEDTGSLFSKATNALGKTKDFQRATTVLSPVFAAANVVRDTTILPATTRTGLKPVLGHLQGAYYKYSNPERYKQYLRETGGGTSTLNFGETKATGDYKALLGKITKGDEPGIITGVPLNSVKDILKSAYRLPIAGTKAAVKGLETFSNSIENLPRFAEYSRSIDQGENALVAGTRAGEVTIPFHQKGASVTLNQINKVGLFVNANIQGMEKILRTAVKTPKQLMSAGLKYMTVPGLALYGWNSGFDSYYDIPEDVRRSNWIIKTGEDVSDYVKIPFDREIAPLFIGAPMAILDDIRQQTGNSQLIHQLIGGLKNVISVPNATPPAVSMTWDLLTNSDHNNRPIVNPSQLDLPPSDQYTARTHPTSRAVAELMSNLPVPNVLKSPDQLNYVARSLGGIFTDIIQEGLDPVARNVLGLPEPAAKGSAQNPFLSRFSGNESRDATTSVYNITNTFRDELKKMDHYSRVSRNNKESDTYAIDKANKWIQDNPEDVQFLSYLQSTLKDLKQYSTERREIQNSLGISPETKRKMINSSIANEDEIAKAFIKSIASDSKMKKYLGDRYSGTLGLEAAIGEVTQ